MTPDSRLPADTYRDQGFFMQRCLELASLGSGTVAPNPMVGAVLVHNGRIIGEGWHQQYGGPHAEVNCINSVKEEDRKLISHSTLYVSLEPCSHFGKTPPCTDIIITNKIPKLIIGCRDPNKEVSGFEKLKAAGVDVEMSRLKKECEELNKRFIIFHTQQRPYIILKWAQTADGFMAASAQKPLQGKGAIEETDNSRLVISNDHSNRLVHQWRREEASILVGTHTALLDDPELTNRYWPGPSPVRLVIDMDLKLPSFLKIFKGPQKTIIFNSKKHDENINPAYYKIMPGSVLVHQVINALYRLHIQSVLVEGGARLLQSFIDEKMWDEIRIISNKQLEIETGLPAPQLPAVFKTDEQIILSDSVEIFKPVA